MQAIISRAIRLWILQKNLAFCKHLPFESFPPCCISLSRLGTSNGTRVDHFEGLCQVILEIDRYVVKDKLFAQRCQELLDGIPRITPPLRRFAAVPAGTRASCNPWFLLRVSRHEQWKFECGTVAFSGLDLEHRAVRFDDLPHKRKPQARAAIMTCG